jgi:nucleotide-binding universal stress UspA family protein
MQRILVALDGSGAANRALLEAADLARKFGAVLAVACVIPKLCFVELPVDCATVEDAYRRETVGILDRAYKLIKERGIEVDTIILSGDPADEITAYAREQDFDLIAVGSTGKHATRRRLFGSVSSRIAASAHCMVLVVK